MGERTASVSRDIKASPDVVWSAISDITRMGEWSPECHTCEWAPGSSRPEVGATFIGHNRNGDKEWTTQAEIVESVPGRVFAFDGVFGDLRFSHWRYEIEPTADGCRVTESWEDGRPEEVMEMTAGVSGVSDRAAHNAAGMEQTLARLAAALES